MMKTIAKRFIRQEEGLEAIEYAIVAGLIVVGIVATLTAIGAWMAIRFATLETDV
jgi:pilus assembly protein Flp/PilA